MCPDCGVVHISLQYFSVRFDLEAFRALAQMLGVAQARIERSAQTMSPLAEAPDVLSLDGSPQGLVH